jgi:hypothetical protein
MGYKERARELFGIEPDDRRFNIHHWRVYRKDGGKSEMENVIPLPKKIHELIHQMDEAKDEEEWEALRLLLHTMCVEFYG